MATRLTFEDIQQAASGGSLSSLKPADRSSKRKRQASIGAAVGSADVQGALPTDPNVMQAFTAAAKEFGVPTEYVFALAQQESSYKADAHNTEYGADGYFQYIPGTAAKHGMRYKVDTRDPVKAARAAARDFRERMDVGGVEEAILSHFAGPGGGNRGPKSARYLAEVTKRANDIRELLGQSGEVDAGGVGGSSDERVTPRRGTISFEDIDAAAQQVPAGLPKAPDTEQEDKPWYQPVVDKADQVFDHLWKRIQDDPNEYAGQQFVEVERSQQEIDNILKGYDEPGIMGLGYAAGPLIGRDEWKQSQREQLRFKRVLQTELDPETQQIKEREKQLTAMESPQLKGFVANLRNPLDLILNDSLPANFVEALANAPEQDAKKFWAARKIAMQEDIVANPDKFPAVSVAAAQRAIDARTAKQDPTVAQMWRDVKAAAKADPGRFGAELVNALMADPEMIAAPVGLGTKVVRTTKAAVTGAAGSSRVLKTVDRIIDAGSVGAALNLGIEAAKAGSEGRSLTDAEVGMAVGTGFGISGPLGALFARASRTRSRIKSGDTLNETDLESALRDAAQEDMLAEQIANAPKSDIIYTPDGKVMPADARARIEKLFGIEDMSPADRKKWHTNRQKQLREDFGSQWKEADYQSFVAEERLARREALAQELEQRKATQATAAEAEQISSAARRERYQSEYDAALRARDEAREAGELRAAQQEDALRDAAAKLDQQEIIDAAFKDSNEVVRAMQRALKRDAKLRMPKWQRGEADPKMLARVGVGGIFAGAAYAAAEEDYKEVAGLSALLAGLILPGGGSVLSRMRQAGSISGEGLITNLLVKQGKLKIGREGDELLAWEREMIDRARGGDQKAFQALYKENYERVVRIARRYTRDNAARLGVDPEDIAQEVFIKLHANLDAIRGDSKLSTWLHTTTQRAAIDEIRKTKTLKGGKGYVTESADSTIFDEGGEAESINAFEEGGGADLQDTPEARLNALQVNEWVVKAIQELPEQSQLVFLLRNTEGYSAAETAAKLGITENHVNVILKRANDDIAARIEKMSGAKRMVANEETQRLAQEAKARGDAVDIGDGQPAKRGRGRPKGSTNKARQAGEVDPRLMTTMGLAGLGAGVGAWLAEENKLLGAGLGALAPIILRSKGIRGETVTKQIVDGLDTHLGVISTRIKNISEPLWRRAIELERVVLRDTHKHMKNVDPFLVRLQHYRKKNPETYGILARSILTGKAGVTENLLKALGDQELIAGWRATRQTLDSLGDQLVALQRFKRGEFDYFPRIVKDVDGLLKALGREKGSYLEELLKDANLKALKERGSNLTDLEKSLIINRALSHDPKVGQQPGFAKARGVEEITPELQKFYASPDESLHSYIREAVEDIERAKFFGKDLQTVDKANGQKYTHIGNSIGEMVNRLMNEGKLDSKGAEDVANMLRSRFLAGERAPSELIQNAKNLSYAGLLGNPVSAASQLGDVVIQMYTQDVRSAIEATIRSLTGRKIVHMKDFGLSDYVSEEFASTTWTAKLVKKVFKYGLFKNIDEFGKDVALNAAVIRFGKLAKTQRGVDEITSKYGEALGPAELKQLVNDLQKGERSDLVNSIAFAELSRTQPVSRLELPQAYLDNPNGRLLYQYKSFMIKQIDLVRRDAVNEWKKGNYAKGTKNLLALGVTMGIAGASTEKVKDFIKNGRIDEEFKASDIPLNMLKTFGLSEYVLDKALGVSKQEAAARRKQGDKMARSQEPSPGAAVAGMAMPAQIKMFDDIVKQDASALRYIPIIGPWLVEAYGKKEK